MLLYYYYLFLASILIGVVVKDQFDCCWIRTISVSETFKRVGNQIMELQRLNDHDSLLRTATPKSKAIYKTPFMLIVHTMLISLTDDFLEIRDDISQRHV